MVKEDFPIRTQGVRPTGPVSRERVIVTAMGLIDRDGAAALTMRGLAAELGVSKTAVTWHVGDRPQVLAAVGAHWLSTITVPTGPGDGFAWLVEVAAAYRNAAHAHPHLARLAIDGLAASTTAKGALRVPDTIVARLAASGLPAGELGHAYNSIVAATFGFVALELAGGPGAPIPAHVDAIDDADAPSIASHLDRFADHSFGFAPTATRFDESFTYLIELVADGLRRRAGRRSSRRS